MEAELRHAVLAGNVEATQRLLSRKADPNTMSSGQDTLLKIAVRQDSAPLCRLLLVSQADPVQDSTAFFASPSASLVHAWARGDLPVVLSTLEAAVGVAAGSHDVALLGLSLASFEVAGGDLSRIPSCLDSQGRSLLHLCAACAVTGERGEAAARLTARMLLNVGCSANDTGLEALESPLLAAILARGLRPVHALAGAVEPARALLEARADVEDIDDEGTTPIMMAVKQGDLEACQLLIDFGADPWRRSQTTGQSAMDLAAGQPAVIRALSAHLAAHGAVVQDPLAHAVKSVLAGQPLSRRSSEPGPAIFSLDTAESDVKRARSRSLLFTMAVEDNGDVEGLASSDGLLNQIDLEESYETEWSPSHSMALHGSDWSCSTQAANTEEGLATSPPRRDTKALISHMTAASVAA